MNYDVPLRVAVGGNVDSGKSSLIGYLKTKKLDDGNGSSRQCIFNFPHEKISGRTSSVSQKSILIEDKKIIFFDLAGHEKYFRTTLFGISCSYPNIMMILIESNKGILKMTKEHIISAIYLRIPIILILTKIDIAIHNKLNSNIQKIKKIMKNSGKNIYEIKEESNIDIAIKNISETFIPLFQISSVMGNNINPPIWYLTSFLNKLNINKINTEDNNEILFVIDNSFKVDGYPLIGSGYMRSGKININDKLFLGPINNEYIDITIRSIHDDDKNNVSFLRKNEMGCVAIRTKDNILKNKNQLLAGFIITNVKKQFVKKFIGNVNIFNSHSTTIKVGYNTIIHSGAIKKAVKIYKITDKDNKDLECLRGGDVNIIMYFEFINGIHFLLENDNFIFREGNTRGSGYIMKIIE